ncbi:hypothetical protein [Salinicola rhizosphaerae]|uniref:Uncharacterized protein n=1 Tax=Salinicola rhizosphaerae TaxID=1443141 RepID=A0ABQ3EL26_9GAMM|nr:hypothetical protein [Salinicola rhizosphaerae]GHB34104.1 hypothetical protein GCM10009038_36420 [Salinicola rhizosphaerae]
MGIYCLTFDRPLGRMDRHRLEMMLDRYDTIRLFRTAWLIESTNPIAFLRARLGRAFGKKTDFFITRLSEPWCADGIGPVSQWLSDPQRQW